MSYSIKFHDYDDLKAEGTVDLFELEKGGESHTIFKQGKENMYFEVSWTQKGWLWNMIGAKEWLLNFYLESLGEKEVADVKAPDPIPFVAQDGYTYAPDRFSVSTETLDSGTYRMTATLRLRDKDGNCIPFTGYTEGTIVEIYNPKY